MCETNSRLGRGEDQLYSCVFVCRPRRAGVHMEAHANASEPSLQLKRIMMQGKQIRSTHFAPSLRGDASLAHYGQQPVDLSFKTGSAHSESMASSYGALVKAERAQLFAQLVVKLTGCEVRGFQMPLRTWPEPIRLHGYRCRSCIQRMTAYRRRGATHPGTRQRRAREASCLKGGWLSCTRARVLCSAGCGMPWNAMMGIVAAT
jgi:hypothetical protein